jgi:hypothetical protein
MSNDSEIEKKIPNIKVIDPVGAIKARAKVLYLDAGSPADKDWADFFAAAEQQMISASHAPGGAGPKKKKPEPKPQSEMMKAAAASGNVIVSIIGAGSVDPLNESETTALGYVLIHNDILFSDGTLIKAHGPREAAEVAVEVTGDYRSEFLEKHKVQQGQAAPIEARIAYWEHMISDMWEHDEALTNLDRLTIQRIVHRLRQDSRIKEFKYIG